MALRIHSYSLSPDYCALLYYFRDGQWNDLTERLVTGTTDGQSMPIAVSKQYKQIYTAKVTLDNTDGLLSPRNTVSAYNKNAANVYDPLIDEARGLQLQQGIFCYPNIAYGATVTAGVAPSAGTLDLLTDGLYASDENEADANWVSWSSAPSGYALVLKVDLGSVQSIQHGVISILSKLNATPQIALPASVQFEYSADDATYTSIGAAFDMSEYVDSRTGQKFEAFFTDANTQAQYIRITLTNIAEVNDIYVDEISVYGGTTTTARYLTTFTGYMGDQIDFSARSGYIGITWQDTRKKESDNKRVELTSEYLNKRPEEIIYDLLTNPTYWGTSGALSGGLVLNPSFESGSTDWILSPSPHLSTSGVGTGAAHSGTSCAYLGHSSTWPTDLGWIEQDNIPITAGKTYRVQFFSRNGGGGVPYLHVELQPDGGNPLIRYPSGTGSVTVSYAAWQLVQFTFEAPAGCTSCSLKFILSSLYSGYPLATAVVYLDDVIFTEVNSDPMAGYNSTLDANEIGWALTDNLSGFTLPRYQGQQKSILEYCMELANVMGWVYDADGNGVRQLWQPQDNRLNPDNHITFFGKRQTGPDPIAIAMTGNDIRNHIKLVGYEDGNNEVPREYFHKESIAKYGDRYARINEPLIKTSTISDYLGRALLRDFAWAGEQVNANVIGDFDIDRPKYVCSFREPIRAYVDNTDLWAIESFGTQMTVAGKGQYTMGIVGKKYVSSAPNPVSNIAGTGASGQITVSWDASTEIDIDGYYVYWASGDTPASWTFTKRAKTASLTDAITGLSDGTAYWFYVTAINLSGIESDPSAIVRCLAGASNTGSESSTWGISGMTLTLTDNDPTVNIDLAWTPSLTINPDFMASGLCGPSTTNPPTEETEHAHIVPLDGVAAHYYSRYDKSLYTGGTTYYWRLALSEVVVNDTHFRFGTPLYSNVVSSAWPV